MGQKEFVCDKAHTGGRFVTTRSSSAPSSIPTTNAASRTPDQASFCRSVILEPSFLTEVCPPSGASARAPYPPAHAWCCVAQQACAGAYFRYLNRVALEMPYSSISALIGTPR